VGVRYLTDDENFSMTTPPRLLHEKRMKLPTRR
jgi:hypothetical protein